MITETMEPPVTRQELKPIESAPPEPINPARGRLAGKLGEIERALTELEDYKGRAQRAEVDEDRALQDEGLSEAEAAERIARAQAQKGVYQARINNRLKAVNALGIELSSAIGQANRELQGLVNREVARRTEILGARVLAAADVTDTIRPGLKPALADLLDYSEPIERIKALQPSPVFPSPGNNELSIQAAKEVLMKFEKVTAEAGKKL